MKLDQRLLWTGLSAVILTLPLLQGCGAMAVAGIAYGGTVVYERRSPKMVLDDEVLELQAKQMRAAHPEIHRHSRISMTSYNLSLLLTGQAETREVADRFADLVSRLPKVRQVFNEVEVGPYISFARETEDAYLTSRTKLALQDIDIPGFDMMRVKVVTENATVYLMGLVTPEEADAAAEKVRRIPGVVRVVKIFEHVAPQDQADSEG
jgi:osmotically-inducible protein OsmY